MSQKALPNIQHLNILGASKYLKTGAPGEIRTPDLLVRSQALYPTELRAHFRAKIVAGGLVPRATVHQLADREGFEPSMGV
jgi:hypothetical protein